MSTSLRPGDRIGYAAKFLKNTGQFANGAGERRGTFLGLCPEMPATHGLVRWDDQENLIAAKAGDFAEVDYVEHVRKNGSLVALSAIAKVYSARFCLNDL